MLSSAVARCVYESDQSAWTCIASVTSKITSKPRSFNDILLIASRLIITVVINELFLFKALPIQ